jgi:hypothetical protein
VLLKIGNRIRPFNEADAAISYAPVYDVVNRMYAVDERWDIDGRVVLQTNATQTNMTRALRLLQQDYNQYRPDLIFLEDDGIRESAWVLRANECMDGPRVIDSAFPKDPQNVYATGTSYTVSFTARRPVRQARNPIISFQEELQPDGGGMLIGYVGGAINYAEQQVFQQRSPWTCVQRGTAVGLFGWPVPPRPIWPQAQIKPMHPRKASPRVLGPIQQEFEVSWEYRFAWPFALTGNPHTLA